MALFVASRGPGWYQFIWPDGEEGKVMLQVARVVVWFLTVLFVCGLVPPVAAQSVNSQKQVERDAYLDDPANWLEQVCAGLADLSG